MDLSKLLIQVPQVERGGEIASSRLGYQSMWAITLILENHDILSDYAISFEFHDDILLLDSSTKPNNIRFYQIKTKENGNWTVSNLTAPKFRNKGSEKSKAKTGLSILGKLAYNQLKFPEHTESLNLVSNAPFKFAINNLPKFKYEECSETDTKEILLKLSNENNLITEFQAKLLVFIKTDLSLTDSSKHIQGKLVDFIEKNLGEVEYSPTSLMKTIISDCSSRSQYSGGISNFDELIKFKSITKETVDNWLQIVRERKHAPKWDEITNELDYNFKKKNIIRNEWQKFLTEALDQSNEARNRVRDCIRDVAKICPQSLEKLTDVADYILMELRQKHVDLSNPFSDEKLIAMIIYEVYADETTGNVQEAFKELED